MRIRWPRVFANYRDGGLNDGAIHPNRGQPVLGLRGAVAVEMLEHWMPHGACYAWEPSVLWPTAIGHGLIALAYLLGFPGAWTITLRRIGVRPNIYDWLLSAFVVACGAGHALSLWNIWHGNYRAEGAWLIVTAIVSWMFVLHVRTLSAISSGFVQGAQSLERD